MGILLVGWDSVSGEGKGLVHRQSARAIVGNGGCTGGSDSTRNGTELLHLGVGLISGRVVSTSWSVPSELEKLLIGAGGGVSAQSTSWPHEVLGVGEVGASLSGHVVATI